MKRALLDTNFVLNVVHNPTGFAARAFKHLRRRGVQLYVSEYSRAEAEVLAKRNGLARGGMHHWDGVDAVLRAEQVIYLEVAAERALVGINSKDEPLARTARSIEAVLITDDLPLIDEAQKAGVEARQSLWVMRDWGDDHAITGLESIARVVPWTHGGYLFARGSPGGWVGQSIKQDFVLAELLDDHGRSVSCGYDGRNGAWFLRADGEAVVSIRSDPPTDEVVLLAQVISGGRARLSLGGPDGANVSSAGELPVRGDLRGFSHMSIGHTRNGSDHWNGYVKDLVAAPGPMSKKMFPILVRQGLTPNPMDDNGLRDKLGRPFLTVAPDVLTRGSMSF